MITKLDGMPDGVIGVRISGEVHASDYDDVVFPAIDAAAERGEIRVVVLVDDLDKMSGGAAWDDLRVGTHHLSAWKRTAFVSDVDWMTHLVAMFGWMSPGKVKHFPVAELDDAIAWVATD
ncbi:MAG TPA: STAS/SEC14 domain-containing protein [Microthrixaceae bacterium]|nr:STAS/SEC14 domain-containing protein [Microthrixaceae bacterium]